MTTPRRQGKPAKQPQPEHHLRPDVAAAIEQAWPDGVIEMAFGQEESWFQDAHPKLARALQRIAGTRLLYEHEAEGALLRGILDDEEDEDDGDTLYEREPDRSYHLFFVSPESEAFAFESEVETLTDPEYDEETGEEIEDEPQTTTIAGRGHTGWSVAVSLIAPFAVITLSDYSVYDDGSVTQPEIERPAEDEDGNAIDPESHFREVRGEELFQALGKLRSNIVAILEKQGVTVLPEAEWRKEVPWLKSDGEALVGDAGGQPVRVLDAFFYQGR